ncbi:hypothetical protein BB8028_0001g15770 [Beauveria bassiana]|uniref:Uncharacterized protein n=1 Tax=Beauveria bassiana TaxID=176275 RepID=A0A2S7Y024_BEABA|nr:hypothetical protein BB8028_0001g15770 [Beauveria bassiana]
MGFLTFLQRRSNDKTSFSNSSSTINLQRSNTPTTAAKLGSQSDADLLSHQHAHRQQHDSQVQYESSNATPTWATSLSHSNAASQQRRQSEPRISAYPNKESLFSLGSGRRQSAITYSDLGLRRGSLPLESCAAAASRYVDLLDAQGQLGSSDFKARLQASGSRDYGEDVAERNIGQNGLLLGSPAVQQFYAAQSSQTSPRRPTTSRYRRYAQKQVILEQPEMEAAFRPSSRASSVYTARSLPIARTRVTPIYDSPIYTEPRRASLASHYTASSMGLPKLQEGSIREEMDSGESDDAAPSIPRFRRSESAADSNAAQQHRPASALGWVSRARQSVEMLSAYDMGEPIWKESVDHMFQDDGASRRPATRNQKSGPATQQQNLSVENMIRWRRTFGEVDDEVDPKSVAATERATESRTSQRQWSIASTEPTERSDASSVYCPRPASRATANTSVDLRSLMELDDSGCGCKAASHDAVVVVDDDVDACSMTTDGSNIDAFIEKRKQRTTPEDQALLFKEGGFFNTGGALPGLFDPSSASSSDGVTPLAETPAAGQQVMAVAASSDSKRDSSLTLRADAPTTTHNTARSVSSPVVCGGSETTESAPEDCRCSSVTTPEPVGGLTVPQIYLNQRQRLLALGFDYDTDEESDELGDLGGGGGNDDDAKTLKQRHGPALNMPRLSIIVEAPPKDVFDSYSSYSSSSSGDDSTAATLRRRKEAKRLSRCGGARVMRVHRSLRDEFDGNVADVE